MGGGGGGRGWRFFYFPSPFFLLLFFFIFFFSSMSRTRPIGATSLWILPFHFPLSSSIPSLLKLHFPILPSNLPSFLQTKALIDLVGFTTRVSYCLRDLDLRPIDGSFWFPSTLDYVMCLGLVIERESISFFKM